MDRSGDAGRGAARQGSRRATSRLAVRRAPGAVLRGRRGRPRAVSAAAVAAHECGHAVQHARGYVPLSIRGALVPVANIGSMAAWPLIVIGLFMNGQTALFLINLGIFLFSAAVLFQIVTLPVEFNASNRAVKVLESSGMLYPDEVGSVKKVLGAAALTYVASAASMILQLLRLMIIGGRKRND